MDDAFPTKLLNECILELRFKLLEMKAGEARDELVPLRRKFYEDYRRQISQMWNLERPSTP